ncbi:M14 family metallopeptidase [Pelagicoccus mobilis]|uniref:M14 family metallocarboxypeptidase n=1 Tax=Pelagicoccus mobilis TaxID=415221 RepID=A0A934S2G2_9BACT|nr:M14 family metallocarboxypeptidase [Pelagicoccus mobilis]MBK1878622.1 M14 family metallocarboxypeptidase [Pelagicoccus mobilis]
MIAPLEFLEEIEAAATAAGFTSTPLGKVESYPIIGLTRPSQQTPPRNFHLYLSTGVHGDEPAGPLALLEILKRDLLPREIQISILPLVNPTGFVTQTRENAQGDDLNREFRTPKNPETLAAKQFIDTLPPFDLSVALHEDWESSGFYMYAVSPSPDDPVFRDILDDTQNSGPIDLAPEIDDSPAQDGLISRPIEGAIESREDWPEAFLLYSKNKHIHLTTETPSSLPIKTRIAMHVTATLSAVKRITARRF